MATQQGPAGGSSGGPYYGKFRGRVLNNIDPLGLGRLQVTTDRFPGMMLNWAQPCFPYAGPFVGFYAVPPIGAMVWVEFEGGDLNYPIWVGCFWEPGRGLLAVMAAPELAPDKQIIHGPDVSLTLDSTPGVGGATLQVGLATTNRPQSITINVAGMTLESPPASVKLSPEGIVAAVEPGGTMLISEAEVSTNIGAAKTTLTPAAILHSVPECKVTVTGAGIGASAPPNSWTLTPELAQMATPATSVGLTAASVELVAEDSTASITPALIEFEQAAASVSLAGAVVNINEGLEVLPG